MLLAVIVYLIPNMAAVEWFLCASAAALSPLLYFLLPESPRWLLATGRKQRAAKVVAAICTTNRRVFIQDDLDKYYESEHQAKANNGSLRDLLRWAGLRRNFLSMCLCWLSFSMAYFGVLYNTPAKEGSVYIVFAIPGAVAILFVPVFPWMQGKLGRKWLLTGPLITSGIILLSILAVPVDNTGMMSILCTIGLLLSSTAFDTG